MKMATKTDGFLIALFLFHFLRKCHPADGFLDIEELKSVHYGLDIISEPAVWNPEDTSSRPGNNIQVTSKYGQQYRCSFPDRIEADKKKEEEEKVAMETGIPELLKPLEAGPCLFKNKDWWSYEFCYGKYIRQFHIEDGKIVGDITFLGYYDSEYDWNNTTKEDKRVKNYNRLNRYHSQQYVNGTRCDLTARTRRTEVRFVCAEGVGDSIFRIDEPETCGYILTVQTTKICHHPYLKPPTKNTPIPITCQPLLSESQFTEYQQQQKLEQQRLKDERERKMEKERQENLQKQKLEQEQLAKLEEQSDKSPIQNVLKYRDITWQSGSDSEAELDDSEAGLADDELNEMMEATLGNNKGLEKKIRNSLQDGKTKHTEGGDDHAAVKPIQVRVVRNMDELKEAVRQAHVDAEAFLRMQEEAESNDSTPSLEGEDTEDSDEGSTDTDDKTLKFSKVDGRTEEFDDNLDEKEMESLDEFRKDLEDIDILKVSQYKEYFRKNKNRFLSMKNRIKESMMKEFNSIITEAGEELGMTEEEINTNVNNEETFTNMADILNRLLEKLETTEKYIEKVDKEITLLQEKSEGLEGDTDNESGDKEDLTDDDLSQDSDDYHNKVKGPDKAVDDRVKIRVTKITKADLATLNAQQNSQTEKLEKEVEEGLEKAGLDLGGGKIQVKIITAGFSGDEDNVHVLSDEETKNFKNMIVSILEGDTEAAREEDHHQGMEESYRFVWGRDKKKDQTSRP